MDAFVSGRAANPCPKFPGLCKSRGREEGLLGRLFTKSFRTLPRDRLEFFFPSRLELTLVCEQSCQTSEDLFVPLPAMRIHPGVRIAFLLLRRTFRCFKLEGISEVALSLCFPQLNPQHHA